MTSYANSLAWLYGTQLFGIKLGLENMRRLLAAFRLERPAPLVIHVAGTNGKGSTCAMIDRLCRATGLRTGLFTSPHLVSFCERIRVNGACIPENEAGERLHELRVTVEGWDPHPTFFELTTALALWWFQDAACDAIVLETGMGGRLDATNALTPDVCVITPVGLDHQQWLGDTLAEIAAEKAGIIKPGVPVICGPQPPEALRVITTVAAERGAPLTLVEAPFPGSLSLPGPHQRWNAAAALAAVTAAALPAHAAALRHVVWPGRFQRLGLDGRTVLDGAHNPHGAAALVEAWREVFGAERATVIFGAVAQKNHAQVIATLSAIADRFVFTTVNSPRAVPAEELAEAEDGVITDSLPEALAVAGKAEPLLICGSLYLIGEALALLDEEAEGEFEPSAQ